MRSAARGGFHGFGRRAWTESEAFQKAHRQGRSTAGTILGPPKFVGWQVVL
jgi:heme-degrading monooxygenase HmoA